MYSRNSDPVPAGSKAEPQVRSEDIEAQIFENVSNEDADGYLSPPTLGRGSKGQRPADQQTNTRDTIAALQHLKEHEWPLRFEAIEDRKMRVSSAAGHWPICTNSNIHCVRPLTDFWMV